MIPMQLVQCTLSHARLHKIQQMIELLICLQSIDLNVASKSFLLFDRQTTHEANVKEKKKTLFPNAFPQINSMNVNNTFYKIRKL